MEACKQVMYSAQGEMLCIEQFENLTESCTPTCPKGKAMLDGTTSCYPSAKVNKMNTCLSKLVKKPTPSAMGDVVNRQQNSLYNSMYAAGRHKCETKLWKPAPVGTPAQETCVFGM